MTFTAERYASRGDTVAFVVCIVLAVIARISPPEVTEPIAATIRGTVLAPLLGLQEFATDQKNSRLRYSTILLERDSLAIIALFQNALREENDRLRALVELRSRVPVEHVPAEVLHQSLPTDGLSLVLSAGSRQGVTPLSAVIVPEGLVGVVRSVDANSSVAVFWAHPEFRASAMALDGSLYGTVEPHSGRGLGVQVLELTGVRFGEDIAAGTPIYTSGLGGVYPRGVPLGEILGVASERAGWERTYLVRPAVHPASVSHVIILLDPAADLRAVFADSADQ